MKDYGFWFAYICNNQLTEKYRLWPTNTLKELTTLAPQSLTYIAGAQTINSVCSYLLQFRSPTRIPYGGYIEINLPAELDAFDDYCYAMTTLSQVSTGTTTVRYGPIDC